MKFNDQPPLLRLLIAFSIVVVAGTLFFWFFLYAGSVFMGVTPARMIQLPGGVADEQAEIIIKYLQFSQHVGVFLLPAIITGWMFSSRGFSVLGLGRHPLPSGIVLVVLAGLIIIPVIDFTSAINSKLVLHGSLSGVQEWIRAREDTASKLTGVLVSSEGMPSLLVNYFLIAILPAISEEMLFRGILQKLLNDLFRSGHAAVWVTAIIFSSIHLQFFGFLPRLILGLLFGYLFYWSGNLWYPVTAHFVNNAIPVTIAYFSGNNQVTGAGEVKSLSFLFMAGASSVVVAVILYFFRKLYSGNSAAPSSGATVSNAGDNT
ncbi:MAG TPA: CPBP family intramembrane glutamic endopeptidase [Bacteroidales bacterium]|nr:CPBP family intramembrane glutamic endopeptidase [Bacteroidales bacterium]